MMTVVDIAKIPQSLQALHQWVLWRSIPRPRGFVAKMPFQASGKPAKSNDASTWESFASVTAAYDPHRYSGIGFVFSEDDPFCGVDLDGCRDPQTGIVSDWARQIIIDLDTYAEVSPSGTGVKLFARAFCEVTGRKKLDAELVSDKAPGIEIYDHLRYFAVTGWRLQGPAEPQPRDSQVGAAIEAYWGVPTEF